MSETEDHLAVVKKIVDGGGQLVTHATAQPFEVYALLEATHADVVDDARKTIILAKQAAIIESLTMNAAKGTDVEEEKSDNPAADTEN